jgi:hypothetical protein
MEFFLLKSIQNKKIENRAAEFVKKYHLIAFSDFAG